MDKIEPAELINAVFSTIFLLLLVKMSKPRTREIPGWYLLGTVLVLLGNFFTVLETFFLPTLFNDTEHLSFTLGSACFLIGSINSIKRNG